MASIVLYHVQSLIHIKHIDLNVQSFWDVGFGMFWVSCYSFCQGISGAGKGLGMLDCRSCLIRRVFEIYDQQLPPMLPMILDCIYDKLETIVQSNKYSSHHSINQILAT